MRLISYEEAIRQAAIDADDVEMSWVEEGMADLKTSLPVQRELLYQTVVRLHATGKYSDEYLLEFARRCLAKRAAS